MDGGAIRTLKLFQDICGAEFLRNSAVITTMWDKYPGNEKKYRETERELINEYWYNCLRIQLGKGDARSVTNFGTNESIDLGPASENTPTGAVSGARYMRSDNSKNIFERIIRKIAKTDRGTPKLQRELEHGKSLNETTAGKGLNAALDKLKATKLANDARRHSSLTENSNETGRGSPYATVAGARSIRALGKTEASAEYANGDHGPQTGDSGEVTEGASHGTSLQGKAAGTKIKIPIEDSIKIPIEGSRPRTRTKSRENMGTQNAKPELNGGHNGPAATGQVRNPLAHPIIPFVQYFLPFNRIENFIVRLSLGTMPDRDRSTANTNLRLKPLQKREGQAGGQANTLWGK